MVTIPSSATWLLLLVLCPIDRVSFFSGKNKFLEETPFIFSTGIKDITLFLVYHLLNFVGSKKTLELSSKITNELITCVVISSVLS
jgi:hypothetical protein